MTMTRAEYESIASAIHETYERAEEYTENYAAHRREAVRDTMLEIATALCATNDRFDPRRFISQCAVGISVDEAAAFSHGLRLRLTTGIGATRDAIARDRCTECRSTTPNGHKMDCSQRFPAAL